MPFHVWTESQLIFQSVISWFALGTEVPGHSDSERVACSSKGWEDGPVREALPWAGMET